jgi:hypothetical protein
MFARFQSMKRLTCVASIMLTTSASLQQCHAFCQLGLCGNAVLKRMSSQVTTQVKSSCHGCCRSATIVDNSGQPKAVPPQPQCPCGTECWCSQPAEPREVPRNSTGTAKTLVILGVQSPTISLVVAEPTCGRDHRHFFADEELFTSSSATCAQLCRFLT